MQHLCVLNSSKCLEIQCCYVCLTQHQAAVMAQLAALFIELFLVASNGVLPNVKLQFAIKDCIAQGKLVHSAKATSV